jgi:lysophospholipase L1-like esterase
MTLFSGQSLHSMKSPLFFKLSILFVFILSMRVFSAGEGNPELQKFQKWEKEIAAIEERHKPGQDNVHGIVFVGSSSIRMWTSLAEDFPLHRVLNHGFGGSQLSDAAHFADRIVLPYEPTFVVVYSGGNDINAHCTADDVFESYRVFVRLVRERLPETPIAYISIAGNPKRWAQVGEVIRANALIEAYTKQNPGLIFIDVFHPMLGVDGLPRPEIFRDDKLHMNAEGYRLWKEIVGPYLPCISQTH